MNGQLPLEIKLQGDFTFDNFCATHNVQVISHLQEFLSHPSDTPLTYLWGAPGTGKSHLLQACCQAEPNHQGIYLPLTLIPTAEPQLFENLAEYPLVCLDDLEHIVGNRPLEEACFHLYNQMLVGGTGKIIISANSPPSALPFTLPDLKSRLSAGLIFHVQELPDEDKIYTLQQHTEKRGFYLPTAVAQFLLTHCSRNLHHLLALIETLDKASLAAKRRITLPFAKEILKL